MKTKGSLNIKKLLLNQKMYLIGIILIIIVVTTIVNDKFFTVSNALNVLQQISVLGIVTMAMAMLMISGGIDLSLGTLMSLMCVVMSILIVEVKTGVAVALLVALAVGVAGGALNGFIISKTKAVPLIITLGTSYIYKGLALVISGGHFMPLDEALEGFNKLRPLSIPISVYVLIFMVIVSYLLLNRTRYGRRLVAIGGNEENAYLSGIKVVAYKISIYSICGIYYAIAAFVMAARQNSVTAIMGDSYALEALAAVVVGGVTFEGGKGSIGGAIIGCVLLGLISNSMNMIRVSPHLQLAVMGAIIVIAVVISNISKIRKQ